VRITVAPETVNVICYIGIGVVSGLMTRGPVGVFSADVDRQQILGQNLRLTRTQKFHDPHISATAGAAEDYK